ncbi:putative ubiquinone biosynthesis protein Coq4 [Helianthus debilis subsp. tardiflorus]
MVEGARVRLRGWQQAAVALGSAVGALVDPRRADLIAALGETTGKPAFERVLERMKRNPKGREVLLDRPRVISNNVAHAWDLPENTFGAAYAKFMGSRNFSPDDRPPVRFMETEELAYVAMRARSA